jgi:Uma2 family endonuclease
MMLDAGLPDDIAELTRLNPHVHLTRNLDGETIASPAAADAKGRIAFLCMQLALWHGDYRTGELFDFSTGFRFKEGVVLFPDAAWVERKSWHWLSDAERCRFPPVCPTVAFEVLLPGEAPEIARERVGLFLEGGAKCVAFIDVSLRTISLHRSGGVDTYANPREVRVIELGYFTVDAMRVFA